MLETHMLCLFLVINFYWLGLWINASHFIEMHPFGVIRCVHLKYTRPVANHSPSNVKEFKAPTHEMRYLHFLQDSCLVW